MRGKCLGMLVGMGCCIAAAASAQTLPADIAESKVIRIALNTGYPPLEMRNPQTNEFEGFDVDLAKAIGAKLGVKVEHQDGAFEVMTPALQSGRVDMIMSGFYDTPKRRPMFTFIDYLKAGAQFYALTSATDIKEPADLCGKTVTTQRGSSYPDTIKAWSDTNCVGAGKEPITVIVDTDTGQQLTNLKTERAAAAVQGLEAVPAIIQIEPGVFRPLGEPFSSALMGIAFRAESTELRDAVAGALKAVIADGTYDELIKKWKLDLSAYKEVSFDAGPQP
ncbi:ABC transporter substrate-binding protein [Mangrovicella endophytica]|uniref:ABC transporter substrate-binding protein n=1 Tax=Mangrovicella endophytica TaxID=2066697 RepID=UPI001300040D|nr:ABC transporter substrate-binding protein [Mangrovicella endophytica]